MEKAVAPTPALLPGESHGQRSPLGCSNTSDSEKAVAPLQYSCLENPRDGGASWAAATQVIQRRQWHPLQYSCLENPMDGGAWWAAVHGVAKSQTRLSDLPFTFHFPALEKAMAAHSSVLAWRTPGTGEPGGLPSVGSHRVGHSGSALAAAAAYRMIEE